MAELIISLSRDELTGRQSIRVGYRADDDAIPHEHEVQHRRLVRQLFPALEIVNDPEASVRVQRERPAQEPVVG
jgi:hypothetical protein